MRVIVFRCRKRASGRRGPRALTGPHPALRGHGRRSGRALGAPTHLRARAGSAAPLSAINAVPLASRMANFGARETHGEAPPVTRGHRLHLSAGGTCEAAGERQAEPAPPLRPSALRDCGSPDRRYARGRWRLVVACLPGALQKCSGRRASWRGNRSTPCARSPIALPYRMGPRLDPYSLLSG